MKRLWPLLLASGVGFTLLCGLGTWQVQRLAQKQALIATLQNRMAVEPIALAQALNRNDAEYLKVRATGQLDVAHVLYKQTIFRGLAGWEAIGPLKTVDGIEVLVDLGAAPTKGQRAKAISEVTGILRMHDKGKGVFDNANNVAANEWFWWDLPAMRQAAGLGATAAPVILQVLANDSGYEASEPKVELANNHLGYAITWFGLAAALAGVTAAFVFQREQR